MKRTVIRLGLLAALLASPCLAQWNFNIFLTGYPALNTFLQSLVAAQNGTSLPATCTLGKDFYFYTGSGGPTLYYCSATNVWTATQANPMTTAGDFIYGGASGTPTRLGQPGNGLWGVTFASSVPSWTAAAAANAATTPNGQTCTLGSACNVNSGAAQYSVAVNGASGTAIGGVAIGTAGRLLIDQGAGANPAFSAMSQDCTITSAGAVTCLKTNNVSFGTAATMTGPATGTITGTIASGSLALATTSIAANGACQTVTAGSVNSATATNVATTDSIVWTPNGSIKAVTGYNPNAGQLQIVPYPTAGYVNFDVCNPTSGAITPGAVTLNWRVSR